MDNENGIMMGSAISAVLQMQADSVKLLRDIDRSLQGYKPLLGNYVTLGIGGSINSPNFMADGLFRHYSLDGKWGNALVVTICYFDLKRPERLAQPVFVAASLDYLDPSPDQTEKQKRAWDAWFAYVEWASEPEFGEHIVLDAPLPRDAVTRVEFVAAPLYSITSLDVASGLIDRVRKGVSA